MGIRSFAIAAASMLLSSGVSAGVLTYGGYSHDTDTDIVTGNGLEWLQWDRTVGESINSIQSLLGTVEGGGWHIASNAEMAPLLNAFNFGITFDTDENSHQLIHTGYAFPDTEVETDETFVAMFGNTYTAGGFSSPSPNGHYYTRATAIYGTDQDGDDRYNMVTVMGDYTNLHGYDVAGRITDFGDVVKPSSTNATYGVALVRDVTPVPVPAAIWLFGGGLLGFIGMARRKAGPLLLSPRCDDGAFD